MVEKFLISTLLLLVTTTSATEILSTRFIQSINEKQSSWIAGPNFAEDTPLHVLKRLAGTFTPNTTDVPIKFHEVDAESIPETFDARIQWPQCESIGEIRDQGRCGSCWAFASSEVMTDRICISSQAGTKFQVSPDDLVSCCTECGSCDGGYVSKAFNYYVQTGVVSGGDFGSSKGCKPYEKEPFVDGTTPSCSTKCLNPNYGTPYEQDKHFGDGWFYLSDVSSIQAEIMKSGSVVTHMDVYDDFYNYQSGVYQYTSGTDPGGHAVKIIGWGTENNLPYWLIANSWGTEWGSLGGFFKILRGENNCRVEQWVYTEEPKL